MVMPNQTENPSESMLRKIAEANTMCYHAQCHFRNASSLAADGPYHRGKKNKPLINAVREARLGSNKLQTSFALLRKQELLVRKHPLLVTQEGSIPTEDLQEIDLRSDALFATNNNKADHASDRELLKHCSSILRFVHRCEEISAHQRKLLEALEAQVQAENPPVVQRVHHHHHYNHYVYHQQQHQHDMSDPKNHNVPLIASALTPLDRILSNSNPKQPVHQDFVEQQRYDFDPPPSSIARRRTRLASPNPKQPVHQDFVEQQRYDFDPPPSPIARRRTRLAGFPPKPDEEFVPLPFDQAVDLSSLGEEDLTSIANSDEEFEPLPIDKAMDLSLEELDLKPIETMMSSSVSSLPNTTQNQMLTHGNRQEYKPEFKKDTNAIIISQNTTGPRKSFSSQSTAAAPPAAAVGDKKQPKIRRTRSGGLLEKRRRRPQKRSPKMRSKKDMKKYPDEMWKLALGGRMDFMQKDVGYTPKTGRQRTHSESGAGLDKNEDTDSDSSRGRFAFDYFPLGLPDFSRRSHSCSTNTHRLLK